jgi:hypothetical protein
MTSQWKNPWFSKAPYQHQVEMPEMVPPVAMGMDLGGTKTDPFWVAKKNDPSWKLLAILAIPSYPHDSP